jgi:hypothetical protein
MFGRQALNSPRSCRVRNLLSMSPVGKMYALSSMRLKGRKLLHCRRSATNVDLPAENRPGSVMSRMRISDPKRSPNDVCARFSASDPQPPDKQRGNPGASDFHTASDKAEAKDNRRRKHRATGNDQQRKRLGDKFACCGNRLVFHSLRCAQWPSYGTMVVRWAFSDARVDW